MLIRDQRPTINFMDSYRAHYGGNEDVVIRDLASLPGGGPAVRLELACLRADFSVFRIAEPGEAAREAVDATLRIDLTRANRWEGTVRPVKAEGIGHFGGHVLDDYT